MSGPLRGLSSLPSWALLLIAALPVLVLVGLARPLLHIGLWAFHGATLMAAAWGLACSVLWWRTLDEANQESQKFAWLWGGTAGLALAAMTIIAIQALRPLGDVIDQVSRSLPGWRAGPAGFIYGILFTALAQLAGFTIVWIGWWAAARKPR